jgi:hypothetical protein
MFSVLGYAVLCPGTAVAPWTVDALRTSQEVHESVWLTLSGLTVTSLELSEEWIAQDARGDIRCDDLNDYTCLPEECRVSPAPHLHSPSGSSVTTSPRRSSLPTR